MRREKLQARLCEMLVYERVLHLQGIRFIAGVDEAGRGPLAGPVVAAAVVLPADFAVLGVDDSKKVPEKKRELLFEAIQKNALAYCIGIVDNQMIDEINILEATKAAMKQALEGLPAAFRAGARSRETGEWDGTPQHVLIDAVSLKDLSIPQTSIIKGDAKSVSIAAASILAKVTRDRLMREHHEKYPAYAFDKNKGYGTKAHYEGIRASGLCPLHRKTFLKNL